MSEGGYKIRNQNAIHFITFSVVQWVDVLSRPHYKDIIKILSSKERFEYACLGNYEQSFAFSLFGKRDLPFVGYFERF